MTLEIPEFAFVNISILHINKHTHENWAKQSQPKKLLDIELVIDLDTLLPHLRFFTTFGKYSCPADRGGKCHPPLSFSFLKLCAIFQNKSLPHSAKSVFGIGQNNVSLPVFKNWLSYLITEKIDLGHWNHNHDTFAVISRQKLGLSLRNWIVVISAGK